MFEIIRDFGQASAALLLGLATGAGWVAAIIAPNSFYDELEDKSADEQVRGLLKAVSGPVTFVLLAAGALAILGNAYAAGVTALLAAFGFFSNSWTLAPHKKKEAAKVTQRRHKTKRVVAVSLTLIFTLVTAIGAVLAVFGL
ncbi:MAG: hypothetical protein QNI84_11525 [Henriciella sp.]|nr:hypothetical protein [Henriciella sp.]